jgi:hypothetical protein
MLEHDWQMGGVRGGQDTLHRVICSTPAGVDLWLVKLPESAPIHTVSADAHVNTATPVNGSREEAKQQLLAWCIARRHRPHGREIQIVFGCCGVMFKGQLLEWAPALEAKTAPGDLHVTPSTRVEITAGESEDVPSIVKHGELAIVLA